MGFNSGFKGLTWLRFFNLTKVFLTLTELFPSFFLSFKANARVQLAKMGHGPHSSTLVHICVVLLLFVLFYVLLFVCKCVLPPGDNPIAVNKYIISWSFLQEPISGDYFEPVQSIHHLRTILILLYHLHIYLQSAFFNFENVLYIFGAFTKLQKWLRWL